MKLKSKENSLSSLNFKKSIFTIRKSEKWVTFKQSIFTILISFFKASTISISRIPLIETVKMTN